MVAGEDITVLRDQKAGAGPDAVGGLHLNAHHRVGVSVVDLAGGHGVSGGHLCDRRSVRPVTDLKGGPVRAALGADGGTVRSSAAVQSAEHEIGASCACGTADEQTGKHGGNDLGCPGRCGFFLPIGLRGRDGRRLIGRTIRRLKAVAVAVFAARRLRIAGTILGRTVVVFRGKAAAVIFVVHIIGHMRHSFMGPKTARLLSE